MSTTYTHVRRHGILLFFKTSKFLFFLIPLGVLMWIFYAYENIFSPDFTNYILLPILLISINYIFLQLILNSIDYFWRIILIGSHAIILIHTSLLLVDDIEYMDMKSILKVDVVRHGLFANIFNYGHLLLEQRNDIRTIHYIPSPHAVYQVVKSHIPLKNTESKV